MKSKSKRSNLMVTILSIIMFLLGICIFLYPTVSNYLANIQYKRAISSYENTNKEINNDKKEHEYEEAVKYNKSLVGDEVYDPFIPGSGYALPDNYEEVLNINGDGIMGYIEIPKIKVKIPIYHGSTPEVLQKGIGHLETSALPIGGVGNNPVLTGHRGLPSAELFTRLDELKKDDLIYISVLNDVIAYKVSNIVEILPGDVSKLGAYKERDMITLITCTPYGINTHRLVIQGDRTPYIKAEKESIKPAYTFKLSESTIIRIIGIILGLIFLFIAIKLLKNKDKFKNKLSNTTHIKNDFNETKENLTLKVDNNKHNNSVKKKKTNTKKKKKRKNKKKRGSNYVKKKSH